MNPVATRRRWLQLAAGSGAASLLGACAGPAATGTAAASPAGQLPSTAGRRPAAARDDADLALLVLNRLAFGPRPGQLDAVRDAGIEQWIEQQLAPDSLALPPALETGLATLETLTRTPGQLIGDYRGAVASIQAANADNPGAANQVVVDANGLNDNARRVARRSIIGRVALETGRARLLRAIDSPRQLEEVLVDFWFNHFNVFIGKGLDRVLVGHYETHAIRPHVLGNFRAMLGATARHPAMLVYLDNAQSVAPGFEPPNRNGPRGLNENYARELMELHTLGADAGYTQADVTELARLLTGWTFDPNGAGHDVFRFIERRHDRGSKTWLGRQFSASGIAEGQAALDTLAAHPATARRIGFKLAQLFVADQPPPALVAQLASRFEQTGGEIRPVLASLFASRQFRDAARQPQKFKTPYQYLLSGVRASGISAPTDVAPLLGALNRMGMPLYGCQTPDGYKNVESAWLDPEAMNRRVQFAAALAAGRLPLGAGTSAADPDTLWATIGPMLGAHSRDVIGANAAPVRSALLLGSPEFMRR